MIGRVMSTVLEVAAWLAMLALLTGCTAHSLGYGGEHPGYLRGSCSEAGAMVSIQGTIAVGPGGAGNNAISVNCRGSFTIEQGKGPAPALPSSSGAAPPSAKPDEQPAPTR